jgi:hypothetical protein
MEDIPSSNDVERYSKKRLGLPLIGEFTDPVTVCEFVIAIVEPVLNVNALALKQALELSALQSKNPFAIVRLLSEDRLDWELPEPILECEVVTMKFPRTIVMFWTVEVPLTPYPDPTPAALEPIALTFPPRIIRC